VLDVEQLANCLPLVHLMACHGVELLPIVFPIVGTLVQNFIYISIQVQDLEFVKVPYFLLETFHLVKPSLFEFIELSNFSSGDNLTLHYLSTISLNLIFQYGSS
jgi:hypothetical protein